MSKNKNKPYNNKMFVYSELMRFKSSFLSNDGVMYKRLKDGINQKERQICIGKIDALISRIDTLDNPESLFPDMIRVREFLFRRGYEI